MQKLLKTGGSILLLFFFHMLLSQNAEDHSLDKVFTIKSDKTQSHFETNITIFEGNVSFNSEELKFEGANRIIYDTKSGKMQIFMPENFKLNAVKTVLVAKKEPSKEYMIYYPKESKLEL